MAELRERVPWWLKIGAKLVLARLPVPYAFWWRLALFRHGAMDDPDYAYRVFTRHFERLVPKPGPGFVALELGPGDSLFSALVVRSLGASRYYAVDTGAFAKRDLPPYFRMAAYLRERGVPVPDVSDCTSLANLLSRLNAVYLTDGIRSLRQIPDGSVHFVWSQAMLEHLRRREFPVLLRELRRILRDDGSCSHRIDLRDHLQNSLNNLRFPDWFWENEIVARSGFYTNRIRFTEMLGLFQQAGFRAEVVEEQHWSFLPLPRRSLARQFRKLSDQELSVSGFDVILRPR